MHQRLSRTVFARDSKCFDSTTGRRGEASHGKCFWRVRGRNQTKRQTGITYLGCFNLLKWLKNNITKDGPLQGTIQYWLCRLQGGHRRNSAPRWINLDRVCNDTTYLIQSVRRRSRGHSGSARSRTSSRAPHVPSWCCVIGFWVTRYRTAHVSKMSRDQQTTGVLRTGLRLRIYPCPVSRPP
jgi:hypothetical protein